MGNAFSNLSTDSYRRLRVLAIISASLVYIRYSRLHHPLQHPRLAVINDRLKRYQPFHLLLLSLLSAYVVSRLSLLLTLNAPIPSLTTEPDMHYSAEFSAARYFLTAFDAAILATHHIQFAPLRHLLSSVLGVWYLVNKPAAEEKVHLFRSSMTTELIRAMWNKGAQQPLLRFTLSTPKLPVQCHSLTIPSTHGTHPIRCCLFYSLPLTHLPRAHSLVLDFPGGGFVSMPPECHSDYLSAWAAGLGVPVLSVDYGKAPERPYPAGLLDCWDVYRQLVETEGAVIGMNVGDGGDASERGVQRPLRIALCGDSSGGSLVAAVTLKAIESGVRVPAGVHLIYPCLDFVSPVWREADAVMTPAAPPAVMITDENESVVLSTANSYNAASATTTATTSAPPQFQLSSRSLHLQDAVLPAQYQMSICRSYLANGGDPHNDYLISPLRAPAALLASFPPLYVHVGGVDPLLDDSVAFMTRVRRAVAQGGGGGGNAGWVGELVVLEKVSHAYLHMTTLLREGREAVAQSERWLRVILHDEAKETVQ